MELNLIRHFPTKGNREKRYIGVTDEPLDLKEIVVRRQRYPEVEVVVTSPMRRCRETAKLLYPEKKQIVCDAFRECDFGKFEGKNYEELKDDPYYKKWLDMAGTIPFPEGESHEAFCARCVQGMEETVEQLLAGGCRKAALVVHGGTIMAILSAFDAENRTFYSWQPKNGEGWRVVINEKEWKNGKKYFKEIDRI